MGGECMGTCCGAHLQTKIRDYAKNAQNGAVTVTVIENPHVNWVKIEGKDLEKISGKDVLSGACDYCKAPAEFAVSYYPKST